MHCDTARKRPFCNIDRMSGGFVCAKHSAGIFVRREGSSKSFFRNTYVCASVVFFSSLDEDLRV